MTPFPFSPALPLFLGAGWAWLFPSLRPSAATLKKLSTRVLQASIVLLGFRFPLAKLLQSGLDSLALSGASIFYTLGLAAALQQLFRIPSHQAQLIGVGTSVCGGSAMAAIAPILRAQPLDLGVAMGLVFLLNAAALVLFPPLGAWMGLSDSQFAVWAALAIHDTSSVVGAASQRSPSALDQATLLKLTRTLWIVPLSVAWAGWASRRTQAHPARAPQRPPFPLFILAFVGVSAASSALPLDWQEQARGVAAPAASWGFALSLGLIGLNLSSAQLRTIGWKPAVYAATLWILTLLSALGAVLLLPLPGQP